MSFDERKGFIFQHHEELRVLSNQYRKDTDPFGLEGNIYTYNGEQHLPSMVNKMRNLYNLAKRCKGDVLEIGFNAGNSALLFLLANPSCNFYAVDACYHSYVKPCVAYLNRVFDNRITLFEGDSTKIMSSLNSELGKTIDIYHIDGCHELPVVSSDFYNCNRLATRGSYLVADDVQIPCILDTYEQYIEKHMVIDCPENLLDTRPYEHRVGMFI